MEGKSSFGIVAHDVTKVKISKTDITTCEEIPGAKLTIFDEKGKRFWEK